MRVLVTGGNGFIGTNLCLDLARRGYLVCSVDDYSGSKFRPELESACVQQRQLSVCDYTALSKVFSEFRPERVVHLAAQASEGMSHISPSDVTSRNVLGSVEVIKACINYEVYHLIFASSVAVYGECKSPYWEFYTPSPVDVYGLSKYHTEQVLTMFRKVYGLRSTIFRFHNVYGNFQNLGDPTRNVVTIFANQLLKKQPLKLFGEGKCVRAWTLVDDLLPYFYQALENPEDFSDTYNIGTDEEFTVEELAKLMMSVLGITVPVELYPLRPEEILKAVCAHNKINKVIAPKFVPLLEGLLKTKQYLLDHGPCEAAFPPFEISKNVPLAWQSSK